MTLKNKICYIVIKNIEVYFTKEGDIIQNLASRLASFVVDNDDSNTNTLEELEYGLKIIINTICIILLTLIPSLFLNVFWEAVLALAAFALIRFFSGGYHIESSIICGLVSSTIVFISLYLNEILEINNNTFNIITCVSLLLFLIFAPFRVDSHLKIKHTPLLFKLVSIIIVSLNLFIGSETLFFIFLFQSLSIIGLRERK